MVNLRISTSTKGKAVSEMDNTCFENSGTTDMSDMKDNSTIAWIDGENKLNINPEPLCDLLSLQSIRNLPIALISINGRMRQGKSFTLNQMIKFLISGEFNPNWIDTTLKKAFVWDGGLDRVTNGIQIYPEPFIVSGTDGDVAVILMDTQGIHDDGVGVNETYKIFGLSALLSSVVIFNDKVHNADTFKTIYDFANYTTTFKYDARDPGSDIEPVSLGNLLMLFRDWPPNTKFPFGLYSKFGQAKDTSLIDYFLPRNPTSANASYRNVITRVFSDVSIYAMSGPGNRMPDLPEFTRSETWEPDFKKGVVDFVTSVFSREFISQNTKVIHGENLKAESFITYVRKWADEIKKNDYNIRNLTTFESNVVAYFENKIKDSMIFYQNELIKYNVKIEKLDLAKVHFEIMGKVGQNIWNVCKFQNRKNEFYKIWDQTALNIFSDNLEAQIKMQEESLKGKIGLILIALSFGISVGCQVTTPFLEAVAAPAVVKLTVASVTCFGLITLGSLALTVVIVGVPLLHLLRSKRNKSHKNKNKLL